MTTDHRGLPVIGFATGKLGEVIKNTQDSLHRNMAAAFRYLLLVLEFLETRASQASCVPGCTCSQESVGRCAVLARHGLRGRGGCSGLHRVGKGLELAGNQQNFQETHFNWSCTLVNFLSKLVSFISNKYFSKSHQGPLSTISQFLDVPLKAVLVFCTGLCHAPLSLRETFQATFLKSSSKCESKTPPYLKSPGALSAT